MPHEGYTRDRKAETEQRHTASWRRDNPTRVVIILSPVQFARRASFLPCNLQGAHDVHLPFHDLLSGEVGAQAGRFER
jgi:hypothetical protein